MDKRFITLASGSLMVIACIFYITSNALPSWSVKTFDASILGFLEPKHLPKAQFGLAESSIGLWRVCLTVVEVQICYGDVSSCESIKGELASACHKMLAARSFVTLACIFSAISGICLFACLLESINKNTNVITMIKIIPIICFIIGIIGLALGISYTTVTGPEIISMSLGAGAILAIIAVILNLIGVILALTIR
ncbi:unnamed protein product [Adineta ricciae]|uniref:Uncharacterized protein n=1 Tax=Adineta ricciae TaxID=249248 RepID=A0A816FGM4_ADIRI|nr:unnamed protein product [Adineta ricciae]